jgi:capsular exopolysaccharide synthesis family protein
MYERSEREELELRHYTAVVWRRKGTVFLVTFLVVAAAIAYSVLQEPIYRSTADVLLQNTIAEQLVSPDAASTADAARNRIDTEIAVMKSKSVKSAVADKLGIAAVPKVTIGQYGDTDVVGISATSRDPAQAATIAQTYADTYIEIRKQQFIQNYLDASVQIQAQIDAINAGITALEQPLKDLDSAIAFATDDSARESLQTTRDNLAQEISAERGPMISRLTAYQNQLQQLTISQNLTTSGGAQVVSRAEAAQQPFSPQPVRNGLAAAFIGVMLGVALAFARDHYDDSLKGKEDLEKAAGVPVLGIIPVVASWRDRNSSVLITEQAPRSAAAEAYRTLRTSLQFVSLEDDARVVQVTSPQPSDGKTTTVANLAVALAKAGQRVVIVDCDLRRPRMHEFFGLHNEIGFTSVLLGDVTLAEAVQPVPGPLPLAVLASGEPPPNPSELLSSPRAAEILQALRAEADFVLTDSPPVLPVTDAIVLAGRVDAIVLVATSGTTSRRDLRRAVELLEQVDAPLVGTILNSVDADGDYYQPYYRYGYSTRSAEGEDKPPARKRRLRPWRRTPKDAPIAPPAGRNGDANGHREPVPATAPRAETKL